MSKFFSLCGCLFAVCTDCAADGQVELVTIPGGRFFMGDAQGDPNEKPQWVEVNGFRLMKYEVTNRQNVWEWTASTFPGEPQQIVLRDGGWATIHTVYEQPTGMETDPRRRSTWWACAAQHPTTDATKAGPLEQLRDGNAAFSRNAIE